MNDTADSSGRARPPAAASARPDDDRLVDRLAALPPLAAIPRAELEWLVAHGDRVEYEVGKVIAPRGERIENLWIVLSGHVGIRVDRGTGPRRVMEWHVGDVSGLLPYSRMTGPPGDSCVEERVEILEVHERHFPEMIHRCPTFTAHTVHLMLDRARRFNASELHDEKMISLGKLAAGLAHELNNPASATVRSAKLLMAGLSEADVAARTLGAARLSHEQTAAIERLRGGCASTADGAVLSPIELADRQDEIEAWLERRGADPAFAAPLADTAVTLGALNALADAISGETLDAGLRWVAAGCAAHSLAVDIEQAATRIHELVAAVKKFTHMDSLAGPEAADVEAGLRDTVRVVASKAKAKGASIALDVAPNLPRVHATGGELNQVWLNLIDNALDAIPDAGRVDISAHSELDRVVVCVEDDGPGIPTDLMPRIFDPFFTTKPPGQGTGLGLEITRRLLNQVRGEISVKSRPGRTQFRVSLVAVDS